MTRTIAGAAAGGRQFATRSVQLLLSGMLLTLLAAISISASAQPAAAAPGAAAMSAPGGAGGPGLGPGMHHGMQGGMHGGMGGGMHGGMMLGGSPERMSRMIDHVLDGLGASDAQRSQIKQIAAAAAADVRSQTQAARGLRQRGMQIFTAPAVDAAAAEQLRQQMLQQHEQTSRRMTQAMVDIARVLTPEQRARIGERMRDRQLRMDERMKRMEREQPRR